MATMDHPRKPSPVGVACGRRIASQRALRGWRQYELAERLGVSPAVVCRWETGFAPRAETLVQIAELFGVSESWLLRGDAPEQTPKAA